LIRIVLMFCCFNTLTAATYFVSANGTGDGSIGSPWGLQFALTNTTITAGDTVNLRAGNYIPPHTNPASMGQPQWTVSISGQTNNLITWQGYLDETATVDRQWRLGTNNYNRFKSLTFFDSWKGSNPTNVSFPNGPWAHFDDSRASGNNEWINCIIHDVDNVWSGGAAGALIRGCIIWNAGLNALEHVAYNAPKVFQGNIVGFYSEDAINLQVQNLVMISNVFFGGGQIAGGGQDAGIGQGFSSVLAWNYTYNFLTNDVIRTSIGMDTGSSIVNSNILVGNSALGFGGAMTAVEVQYNVLHMSSPFQNYAVLSRFTNTGSWTVDHNQYTARPNSQVRLEDRNFSLTFANWKITNATFDANSVATNAAFPSNQVVVIPNQDKAKRAHVAVYNWSSNDTATATLSGILQAGDIYEVRSAQDYLGSTVQSGTYNGSSISLPLTNLSVASVLYSTNWGLVKPLAMNPEFASFIVQGFEPTNTGGKRVKSYHPRVGFTNSL